MAELLVRDFSLGTLVALILASALVAIVSWEGVALVADSGAIPRGLPLPTLPKLGELSVNLLTSAAAIGWVRIFGT